MKADAPPSATYRLQFRHDFTLTDAIAIIPYLHKLGISHIYASPLLEARAGSLHGYDIVNHNALNPDIGDEADFNAYIETLHGHGMGQILDFVPNHMGVGGDDNGWWLDVLENGQSSIYSSYFDIDWRPVNPALHNKVLLPFLGDHYGTVLERGDLTLTFDSKSGALGVRYFSHLFPIDPRTYAQVLTFRLDALAQELGSTHEAFVAFTTLIADCKALPRRTALSSIRRQQRRLAASECKRRLAELCRAHPEIEAFVQENISQYHGEVGDPNSFDRLHRLLEAQAYRLASWQVASDEINYRRFFDINELAAIRMENPEVFAATHLLIWQWIRDRKVDGLRIDHPDGLSDPFGYCCRLQELVRMSRDEDERREDTGFYLLLEKILASHESLPTDWPVAHTTGYDIAFLLNGLFIYAPAQRPLSQLYSQFIGHGFDFDELVYERKKLITRSALASELTVLANLLSSVAQADRRTRDFTYQSLRDAIGEVVACFPVYRTYITAKRISDEDRRYVQWAISRAKKRSHFADGTIFDFISDILLLARISEYGPRSRRKVLQFTLRFQQYTPPVMAKGMEDTAFYIYNRLVSLNDVGFDPRVFGISINTFHDANKKRLVDWPHAMVTSSTHDSKRGEDVRARINVLSEMHEEWGQRLGRWSRLNRQKKQLVDDQRAPARNDEYLLYQTLIGAWPVGALDGASLDAFRERIEAYMLKAIKEAKVHTSWTNPNQEYEAAMKHFVRQLFEDPERNLFLADFLPFQKRIARFGLLNSLSQTLLKLTIPGIPDIYQGNELWAFNLVDPDNRQPVDFEYRRAVLQELIEVSEGAGENLPAVIRELMADPEDGRAKLYITWKISCLRRKHPTVFADGTYETLETIGPKAEHLCAFARCLAHNVIIVIATRWFARLHMEEPMLPLGSRTWEDTWIGSPEPDRARAMLYRNVFTNEQVDIVQHGNRGFFSTAQLLTSFPVAVLVNEG